MLDIRKPILLLDEAKTRRNINRMTEKAAVNNVRFRPHFKTHQSSVIGEWFREVGVTAITVSSVSMAEYFAEAGWDDLTIAFPVNLRELEAINTLAGRVSLGLLVDSPVVIHSLAAGLTHPVKVWLAVDTGLGREGLAYDTPEQFEVLLQAAAGSPFVEVRGLLTHFGQTYSAQGKGAVTRVYQDSLAKLTILRRELQTRLGVWLEISIGDTPSCTLVDDLSEVDEIRPGNFVFYDIHQLHIGACTQADIATAAACPVVSVYPERQTILIYGGAVHLSKDFMPGPENARIYGKVSLLEEGGWGEILPDTTLYSISQEHGLVSTTPQICAMVEPGDVLVIHPAHICLAVSALHRYLTLENESFSSFVE